MRLSEICIERPVLSTVMSLVILVLGAISISRLPNRELPDIDPPIVSITTILPGAAPEVVETSITQVLEDEIIGIEGIRHLTSVSREQSSSINVEFELYRDVDVAAADVRDRVARARRQLPEEAEEPIISKADSDSNAIMWLRLSGGGLTQMELSALAETRLRDRFSKLPGVARVRLSGERRESIRIWIDQHKLTAHDLVIADVAAALGRENIDIPSGRVESLDQEFTVRTLGEMTTADEYNAMIVTTIEGQPIRIRDIGRAERAAEHVRSRIRVNGEVGVGLGIVRQSKANTLEVGHAVKREIEIVQTELPPGVTFEAGFDSTVFIAESIKDVTSTIFYSGFLVLIVIYIFLRSFRATLIPILAIPVSVVGSMTVLYALDFSINTLTLMGLTLAIGLVVDDAIVVLENISRWIEEGHSRLEAARRGMNQISFAVVAASISVVAVFLPLAFLTDTTGRLFREFGITVASAVAISGFVALTLTPMLCARVLRPLEEETGIRKRLSDAVDTAREGYSSLLRPALNHVPLIIGLGAAWVALGIPLSNWIDREFVPIADRSSLQTFLRAPQGASLEYLDRYQKRVEEILVSLPENLNSFSIVGMGFNRPPDVTTGIIFTNLVSTGERDRSQMAIVDELFGRYWQIPGIQAFPNNDPPLGQSFSVSPIELVVQGPNVPKIAEYADEIVHRASAIPGIRNLQSDLKLDKPQLSVLIDRERANDLGVSVREIASTLQILLGGLDLSTYKLDGETYDVIAQLDPEARANPTDLFGLYVRGSEGLVPLDSVVRLEETISAAGLPHFDRLRSATITANIASGVPLGSALDQMEEIALGVLPAGEGYRITYAGQSEQFFESSNALLFAYILAVILIYLVLAAQFESFVHPATILVAVALSFTGAIVSLMLTGHTLNLFSQIGLVMLVGLVTKNSILIVEFANQLRASGEDARDAIYQAARTRFRPVLMTALSTIAGILPIALAMGAGGESRAPLGVAVVGGMLFASALTFFVVPAVYLGFARLERSPAADVSGEETANNTPEKVAAAR